MFGRSLALLLAGLALLGFAACSGSGGESRADAPSTAAQDAADLEAEIDRIFEAGEPRFGTLNREQVKRMLAPDLDGPFYMVNLIKFREHADYRDGRETGLTGREADALYDPRPILTEIGAEIVFAANVEQQLLGDDTVWEQVAIARYPSRAQFIEMIQRPDFRELSVHKDAGVEKSVVLVAAPIELGDIPQPDPETLPYPPADGDAPFTMVHVLDFHDQARYEDGRDTGLTGREALALYEMNAGPVALPLGVRPALWLDIEGAFVGDGREWNEVRLNTFPSHETFRALTGDPAWAMGLEHRVAGLAASYSMITMPVIDNVPAGRAPEP